MPKNKYRNHPTTGGVPPAGTAGAIIGVVGLGIKKKKKPSLGSPLHRGRNIKKIVGD